MPVSVVEQSTTTTGRTNFILRQFARITRRKFDLSAGPYPHDANFSKPGNFETVYNVGVSRMQLPNLPAEWDGREHWQPLLIKRNTVETSRKLIYYWHGGAFINRITPFHWKFLGRLSRELDADIVLQTYTMVPYAGIPENMPKFLTLYQRVYAFAKENKQQFIMGGDSAGGHITASVLLGLRDASIPLPTQAFMVAPALILDYDKPENRAIEPNDVLLTIARVTPLFRAWAVGPVNESTLYPPTPTATAEEKVKMEHPYAAPLNADWSFVKEAKMPITIIQGTHDILLPEVRQFVQKAKELDLDLTYIEAEGACHAYPLIAEVWGSSFLAPDSEVGLKHLVTSIQRYGDPEEIWHSNNQK